MHAVSCTKTVEMMIKISKKVVVEGTEGNGISKLPCVTRNLCKDMVNSLGGTEVIGTYLRRLR